MSQDSSQGLQNPDHLVPQLLLCLELPVIRIISEEALQKAAREAAGPEQWLHLLYVDG